MRSLYTLTFLFISLFTFAQEQTVSVGANYVNETFYNLTTMEVTSAPASEWDIAFNVTSFGSSILTNGGAGVNLYPYPDGDISNWDDLTSADIDAWTVEHNSNTDWNIGAFDHGAEGFDVGWGIYNTITHVITGDDLSVIQLPNGDLKKIAIESLATGVYTFKYANLDGSDEVQTTISKVDYAGKNFAYYSITNNEAVDREPFSADWDLLFTKYARPNDYYPVSGVLSNFGVEVQQVSNTPVDDAEYNENLFLSDINIIGYDWKEFNFETFAYDVEEDLTYFVKKANGNVYKIVFTAFGGSSTGDYVFNSEMVGTVSIDELTQESAFSIYPNPATSEFNILADGFESDNYQIIVKDLNGKVVAQEQRLIGEGFSVTPINVSDLSNGMYMVNITNGKQVVTKKLMVN